MLKRKKQEQAGKAVKTRTSPFLFGYCLKNVENSASIPAACICTLYGQGAGRKSVRHSGSELQFEKSDTKLEGKKKGVSLKVSVFPLQVSLSVC